VEAYLPRCLDSLLSGAGGEVEIVAVDDGSPDRCGRILAAYADRDPRVRVLHLAANVGVGRARNTGLAHACGRYVWFVDGDDWVPDGALGAVTSRLAATGPDVLVVGHAEVHPDGRWVPRPAPGGFGPPGPLARRPYLLRLAQSACTKVIRRRFLTATGLRFAPGWYEDGPFSHALLLAAPRIDVLNRVCYCYRQRGDGAITGSVSGRHFEVFDQYQRLWEMVDADGGYERFRPDLFRLMIDHYLVIAGNPRRLPARSRRAFFARMAADYRRRLPAGGYPVPAGMSGLKHALVRRDAYLPYAVLRQVWRLARALRRAGPGQRAAPSPAPEGLPVDAR
jgi:glycosyltransferase involved in cell wall biosynthesis